MGTGLSEIRPAQGFAAEVSSAVAILASSRLGFALSTTQVASGAVIGSGLGRKGGAVRWSKAGQIVVGWVLTLPAAGVVGALSALLTKIPNIGFALDAVITVAVIIAIFQISRRNRVSAHNVLSEVEEASEVVASPRQVKKAAARAARAAKKAAKKGKK
jgi:PiT family inorganic phosphate transporter